MRRMLFGLAVGLLTFTGSAWADGPIVQWDRIEGVVGADLTPVNVGPIFASSRWRTSGSGRAMVNLKTGFLTFRVSGVSWAKSYSNGSLGTPTPKAGGQLIGTVVCNSTEQFGPIEWANTPVLTAGNGSVSFEGYLDLPASCMDQPEELVFLIRHTETGPQFGAFILYGAERTIR